MLLELRVQNFALAEQLDLRFDQGFNVLTGETGAGKSLIIDSILLLIGGRGGTNMIRSDRDFCRVEALFDISNVDDISELLEELGIEQEDDQLVVTREISKTGRSRCRVNGRLTTVTNLRRIGECLIDLYGQHEQQSLLKTSRQRMWLDTYAGDEVTVLAKQVARQWKKYRAICKQIDRWDEKSRERERRKDLLQFQCEEIDKANLAPGEDEELRVQRDRLANAERLFDQIHTAYTLLSEGQPPNESVSTALGAALEHVHTAADWEPELSAVSELLTSAEAQIQEASHMLRQIRDRIEANPETLAHVEERLAFIGNLQRKYGADVAAILAYREQIEHELNTELQSDAAYDELIVQRDEIAKTLRQDVIQLSTLRTEAAQRLAEHMEHELQELALENAEFIVSVTQQKTEGEASLQIGETWYACSEHGIDQVEFLFSANPGSKPQSLAKVASGGELSRTMLALKTLLARYDRVPILVFDEVDAGIGGRTATAVGERMRRLATQHQILVVTHHAQIASGADYHWHVTKTTTDEETHTTVKLLADEERTYEIARMLDGTTSETTLQRASELLNKVLGNDPKKAV